jgi:hypothetical protein
VRGSNWPKSQESLLDGAVVRVVRQLSRFTGSTNEKGKTNQATVILIYLAAIVWPVTAALCIQTSNIGGGHIGVVG